MKQLIKKQKSIIVFTVMLFSFVRTNAQDSLTFWQASDKPNPGRIRNLTIAGATVWAGSMSLLYTAWYKDYPQTSFHTFNDLDEWQQLDKIGHLGSAYYLGVWSAQSARWAGIPQRKAAWCGVVTGMAFQTGIELMDAYSAGWGFSVTDMAANTAGSALFLFQELRWGEQRFSIRMSAHESGLAYHRPDVLGSNFQERILKDYNGQTYWLSANIHSFLPDHSRFPSWLNLAFGYGGWGMLAGTDNRDFDNGHVLPQSARVRRYFIAPDIDLSKFRYKSGFLRHVAGVIGFIKFPMPALEFDSKGQVKFHPVWF